MGCAASKLDIEADRQVLSGIRPISIKKCRRRRLRRFNTFSATTELLQSEDPESTGDTSTSGKVKASAVAPEPITEKKSEDGNREELAKKEVEMKKVPTEKKEDPKAVIEELKEKTVQLSKNKLEERNQERDELTDNHEEPKDTKGETSQKVAAEMKEKSNEESKEEGEEKGALRSEKLEQDRDDPKEEKEESVCLQWRKEEMKANMEKKNEGRTEEMKANMEKKNEGRTEEMKANMEKINEGRTEEMKANMEKINEGRTEEMKANMEKINEGRTEEMKAIEEERIRQMTTEEPKKSTEEITTKKENILEIIEEEQQEHDLRLISNRITEVEDVFQGSPSFRFYCRNMPSFDSEDSITLSGFHQSNDASVAAAERLEEIKQSNEPIEEVSESQASSKGFERISPQKRKGRRLLKLKAPNAVRSLFTCYSAGNSCNASSSGSGRCRNQRLIGNSSN